MARAFAFFAIRSATAILMGVLLAAVSRYPAVTLVISCPIKDVNVGCGEMLNHFHVCCLHAPTITLHVGFVKPYFSLYSR